MTRKLVFTLAMIAVSVAGAMAQTTTFVEWDQDEPTIADANANTYAVIVNGARSTAMVQCTGTARPFKCRTQIGTLKPGVNTIVVTATRNGIEAVSAPLSATSPATPAGLKVVVTVVITTQ